jgi:opacity protein-like surface antigen
MKTTIRSAVLALFVLLAGPARAGDNFSFDPMDSGSYRPDRSLWTMNWEIAAPIAGFADYIDRTSLTGISIESRSMVGRSYSAGLSFSYNRFAQTDPAFQRVSGTSTVTGPLYTYADLFAVRATAHYYFLEGSMLQPYVGGGIGGAWAYGFQQMADMQKSENSFNLVISPEAGVMIQLARGATNLGLNLAVRYTWTTAAMGTTRNDQTISGIAGLMWSY